MVGWVGKKVRMVGNLVATKYMRPGFCEIIQFGMLCNGECNFLDTVHFPPLLNSFALRGIGFI